MKSICAMCKHLTLNAVEDESLLDSKFKLEDIRGKCLLHPELTSEELTHQTACPDYEQEADVKRGLALAGGIVNLLEELLPDVDELPVQSYRALIAFFLTQLELITRNTQEFYEELRRKQ